MTTSRVGSRGSLSNTFQMRSGRQHKFIGESAYRSDRARRQSLRVGRRRIGSVIGIRSGGSETEGTTLATSLVEVDRRKPFVRTATSMEATNVGSFTGV